MAAGDIEIKGAAELQAFLTDLPAKVEKNILRGALRAGAGIIEDEARALAPVEEGALRESIRVSAGAKKGGKVYAHVKAGGRKKGNAFYAHFVEFGTRPHEIRPKGALSLFFAGLMRKVVKHPGAQARPFLRPAFDRRAGAAVDAIGSYIRGRIEKLKARAARGK